MSTPTNKQRANWASAAIDAYNFAKDDRGIPYDTIENVVIDLLTDLMHHGRRSGLDIETAYRKACQNYEDEEMERAMDMVHEMPFFLETMKKARDELRFLQGTGARGTNDTETRETIHAIEQAIARAEGDLP
ncbi:MAG: hypothetical protein AB7R40_23975 [Nitrospiraceae bacterium]